MYTKQNFAIAKIADKTNNRFMTSAIYVTPKETVCTDHARLTRVKTVGETEEFAPFLMSATQALEAAKLAKVPVTFTPDTHANGHVSVQAGKTVVTEDKPIGTFPDYERVIPRSVEGCTVMHVNPKLLKELLELHAGAGEMVTFYISQDAANPVLMETIGKQDMQSVLMPMRPKEVKRY